MRLNDIEKTILVAEKEYDSTKEKLDFVNLKLGRLVIVEIEKKKVIKKNPNNPKNPISSSTYYRLLGGMETKTRERAQQISKTYLTELVNEHDTLLEDRKEFRKIKSNAERDGKYHTALLAKREQIETGRRIMGVKETIKLLMEEPDLEGEIDFEREIQLFTSS